LRALFLGIAITIEISAVVSAEAATSSAAKKRKEL